MRLSIVSKEIFVQICHQTAIFEQTNEKPHQAKGADSFNLHVFRAKGLQIFDLSGSSHTFFVGAFIERPRANTVRPYESVDCGDVSRGLRANNVRPYNIDGM